MLSVGVPCLEASGILAPIFLGSALSALYVFLAKVCGHSPNWACKPVDRVETLDPSTGGFDGDSAQGHGSLSSIPHMVRCDYSPL